MTDLISRQAVLNELPHANWGKEWDEALAKAIIESVPTIDPVKHGKWVRVTDGGDFERMLCSECGRVVYSTYGFRHPGIKYCPYCGVKMDMEDE